MYIGKWNNYNGIISISAEVLSVFQKFVPTVKNYIIRFLITTRIAKRNIQRVLCEFSEFAITHRAN